MSADLNINAPASRGAFRLTPRLVVGLGILAIGVLWTLENLRIFHAEPYLDWWPAIIIAAGLVRLLDPHAGRMGSAVIIVVGTVLLLDSLDIGRVDLGDLFPLAIVLVGGKLVWDAIHRKPRPASTTDPGSELHAFAVMSGVRRQSTTREFHGGDANAFMGGVEIDLRHAEIREGEEPVLDLFAMWGGIEVTVPEHWRVVSQVFPLMGGFEDKTSNRTGKGPVVLIRGTVIMGSIEVKNS